MKSENHNQLSRARVSALCVVVVVYYIEDYSLMKLIHYILNKLRPDDVVIVFNRDFCIESDQHTNNLHFIKGSNKLFDISGYFEGFLFAKNELNYNNDGIVIFFNDSVLRKHPYRLIFHYIENNLLKLQRLEFFYSGIPSTAKTKVRSLKYFSTYFIITNFATIDFLSYEVLQKYKYYRRDMNKFIGLLFDYSWRPQIVSRNLIRLLHKKKRCVFFEMALSSIASKENFFIEYQKFRIIKFFRFLLMIKNFIRKITAILLNL